MILSTLKTLVLDEADQLLFMGFKNEVETIMSKLPKKRQILCFSATMDSQVKKLAYRYMVDPTIITVTKEEEITLDSIKQFVVETTDRKKQDALCAVLGKIIHLCLLYSVELKEELMSLKWDLADVVNKTEKNYIVIFLKQNVNE